MSTLTMTLPSVRTPRTSRAQAPTTGLHWSDWSFSVLLHGGLALLYLLWVQETLSTTLTPPADIAITWAAPTPQPVTPPPPPEPPPPPRQKVTPRTPVPSTSRPVAPPTVSAASAVEMPSAAPEPPQATTPAPAPTVAPPAPPEPARPAASTAAADWNQFLQAYMRKHKTYPMSARRMRQQGTVVVEASFSDSGEVLLCTIASGSGFTSLDQAALALVQSAAAATRTTIQPGKSQQLRIPVVYELQDI